MSLVEIARDLYGLPLGEFVGARDARAAQLRADGERDLAGSVRQLRRPTTAAWAVNLLARAEGGDLEQLVALGAALREAHDALDGAELRELNRTQHRVVAALRRQVERLAGDAGQRLSESVARQVEATLRAVMADDAAAAAVATGLLLRELESTGLEPVDVAGAVAVPDAVPDAPATAVRPPARAGRARAGRSALADRSAQAERSAQAKRSAEAEQRAAELAAATERTSHADAALMAARAADAEADGAVREVTEEVAAASDVVDERRRALEEAEAALAAAHARLEDATERARRASAEVTAAAEAADAAAAAERRLRALAAACEPSAGR